MTLKKCVAAVAGLALAVNLAACGQSAADKAKQAASDGPIKVKSCDETLELAKAPSKVLMMSDTNASVLDALGVLDTVAYTVGQHRVGPEAPELEAKLDKIEHIESAELNTGGAKVSTEQILDLGVDLVIGYDTGVDREALRKAGVPVYSTDAMCPNYHIDKASFDLVKEEIDKMATLFDVKDRAEAVKKDIDEDIKASPSANVNGQTAVAVYVTPGSEEFYGYNASSMVEPIFETNGLVNMYSDGPERVFDVTMEDLLVKDPEWIVILSQDPDPKGAMDTFLGFAGADKLKAVKNGHVVHLPFALTDPPSPLSVLGQQELSKKLQAK